MDCPKCGKRRMVKKKVKSTYGGYEEKDRKIVKVEKVLRYDKYACLGCGYIVILG